MTLDNAWAYTALLGFSLDEEFDVELLDWNVLAALAERERMSLRVAQWFELRGRHLPAPLVARVAAARLRHQRVADLASCITSRCDAQQVPLVFPKLLQRAPDTGSDLDVLLGAEFDIGIPTVWSGVPIDVQCRRLGVRGEHARFAERVLARAVRHGSIGALPVPTAEDALLLLALGRVYGRPAIRLSDVAYTARLLRDPTFDTDALLMNAREVGLQAGLSCFLDFVDQVCAHLLDLRLLDARLRRLLPAGPWGRVEFRDGAFRGSVSRVSPVLYLRLLAADLAAGDWDAARRLSLVPLTAASRWRASRKATTSGISYE